MNFGELIFNFSCNISSKIRYLEKLEKKLVKANIAILSNRTCINENILPKFTDIHIYIYICHNVLLHVFNDAACIPTCMQCSLE